MRNGVNKKRWFFVICFILVGLFSMNYVEAVDISSIMSHENDSVFIEYDENYVSLKSAIDRSYIIWPKSVALDDLNYNPGESLPVDRGYHMADEIFININTESGEIYSATLQQAIDNDLFIEGLVLDFTLDLLRGHHASELAVLGEGISFQQLIDSSLQVERMTGSCYADGGYPLERGEICNSGYNTVPKACDGQGECLGWTGRGCSGCPFGAQTSGFPYRTTKCIIPEDEDYSGLSVRIGFIPNVESEAVCEGSFSDYRWWIIPGTEPVPRVECTSADSRSGGGMICTQVMGPPVCGSDGNTYQTSNGCQTICGIADISFYVPGGGC